MAVAGTRVTVAATPTAIVGDSSNTIATGKARVKNAAGGAAVDLGGPAVATGAGYSLPNGEFIDVELKSGDTLYGVTSSGTVVIQVLELGD